MAGDGQRRPDASSGGGNAGVSTSSGVFLVDPAMRCSSDWGDIAYQSGAPSFPLQSSCFACTSAPSAPRIAIAEPTVTSSTKMSSVIEQSGIGSPDQGIIPSMRSFSRLFSFLGSFGANGTVLFLWTYFPCAVWLALLIFFLTCTPDAVGASKGIAV